MKDSKLKQDVIDELDFEPSIDTAGIGVAVEDGMVTLSGHVPTYAQKDMAEQVASRVKGVKGIAQEIEVRLAGTGQTADDQIAKRAVDTIGWNTSIPKGAIQVKVQKGWVTLTGKVDWQYQRSAAADSVRALGGVLGVSNQIEISPRACTTDIKQRIEDALKRNAEVEAKAISVEVIGRKVILNGTVNALTERNAAERAAWSAPGVEVVVSNIVIS
jgi:osmotically-inducible protein OsmY